MKKFSTKYFDWTTTLLINLLIVTVLIYAVRFSFNYQEKTLIDLDVIILPIISILLLLASLWETIIIVDFLLKDIKGDVILDNSKLTILRGANQETFDYKDLVRIDYAGPRTGTTRSLTARMTYVKLTFRSKELYITSLTALNHEVQEALGRMTSKSFFRDRRFFELLK